MKDSRLDRYLDLLRPNADLIEATTDPESSQLEAETHRLIFQSLTRSYLTIFQGDPRHPDWSPTLSSAYAHAAANPDTTYLFATIAGDGTYRLSGHRGTVRFIDIQSGVGFVHNTYMVDAIRKSVVRGPWRVRPKPPWMSSHRRSVETLRALTRFEAQPGLSRLLPVLYHSLRG